MPTHDHITNGVAPVPGCEACDRLVKREQINARKRPEGRLPPWVYEDKNKRDR